MMISYLVVILGAQLLLQNDVIVPATQLSVRLAACAGFSNVHGTPNTIIVSGGYNIGVRYEVENNTVLEKPDFSTKAIANARNKGPSEAFIMKQILSDTYQIPSKYIMKRQGRTHLHLLTNLSHMERAVRVFEEAGLTVTPIYAEDYAIFDTQFEWEPLLLEMYSGKRAGRLWDVQKMKTILKERLSGDLTRSVEELL
jgi:hypothetical protein